jgi:uncharacterized membrane protein
MLLAAYTLYLPLFALLLILFLPTFQGADEPLHTSRADALTNGAIFGKPVPGGGFAGPVDNGINEISAIYAGMPFVYAEKATGERLSKERAIGWSGLQTEANLTATSIYAPTLYAPSALAIGVGKWLNLSVFDSLRLARIVNALLCFLIGWAALKRLSAGRGLAVTVLLLPMAASLSAHVTQDGLLIALSMLFVAMISSAFREKRPLRVSELIGLAVLASIIGMGKMPYALLALLIAGFSSNSGWGKYVATAVPLGATALWNLLVLSFGAGALNSLADPSAQLSLLRADPLKVFSIAWDTLSLRWGFYLSSMVGNLGWLDTPLPKLFVGATLVLLAASLVPVVIGLVGLFRARQFGGPLSAFGALTLSFGLIFGALYMTWTPVGHGIVEGVQGRYFLPLLSIFVLLADQTSNLHRSRIGLVTGRVLAAAQMAWPVLSIAITVRALVWRYYISG